MKSLLIVIVALWAVKGVPHRSRIFGGQDASSGQFPFLVSLNNPNQFCDGSIIDKQWILTAAHCVVHVTNTITVLVGTHEAHSGGIEYNIKNIFIPTNYDSSSNENDIALIQLTDELVYNETIQPISFGDPNPNTTCIAAGWGVTETVDFPEIIQFVELTAIDIDLCKNVSMGYNDGFYLGPKVVCTLADEGKGLCFGDSGGPLICNGKLSGVISYGFVPCAKGYPDVYTKPSAYIDWINDIIENN